MGKYTTTQGHSFSTGEWLDLHFDACRFEYENMVRSLGVSPGWKVLDAGCGNGRFIDVMDELLQGSGEIHAIDLAKENVDLLDGRIQASSFKVPVFASLGDITSLRFADNSFDLIWCANVTQYLNEENLRKAINEFKRVLKPRGLVAIKETDGSAYFFYPAENIALLWDSVKEMAENEKARWFIHPFEMKLFLEKCGFSETSQSTHLIERRAPLDTATKMYLSELFEMEDVCWSGIEKQTLENQLEWKRISDANSSTYILSQPNFFWREGHVVAIGKKL